MVGPMVNSAGIIAGAVAGSLLAQRMGAQFQKKIMLVFGCISMGLGIFMIGKANALPPIVCAMMLGAVLGESCRIEVMVTFASRHVAAFFARRSKGKNAVGIEVIQDQFAVFTVVFCASGLGFFGSMQEGLTGDASMLFIKALLDLPTAMFIAANIGAIIGVLAVPQFLVQMLVILSAGFVADWASPEMLADFSGCGGIIMFATGVRMCGIVQFPILSMLPSLLLVMPLSALWAHFMP